MQVHVQIEIEDNKVQKDNQDVAADIKDIRNHANKENKDLNDIEDDSQMEAKTGNMKDNQEKAAIYENDAI